MTQVEEFDFVAYSTVHHNADGFVDALPSGLTRKRVTTMEYSNPTPGSSVTTYNDGNSYHLASSPLTRTAVKATEILTGPDPGIFAPVIFHLPKGRFCNQVKVTS